MTATDPEARFRQTGWPGLRARLFHTFFLIRRPMTLGVRAVIHDRAASAVFLIRHTYVPGWQLPGGGVEIGETADAALGREVREECDVALTGPALENWGLTAVYVVIALGVSVASALIVTLANIPPADEKLSRRGYFP